MMMELDEREAHCVARLLQGAIYGDGVLTGCTFCKFPCQTSNDPAPHFDGILSKLMNASGVNLSPAKYGALPFSPFPYKKFLKNSNSAIEENLRNFFMDKALTADEAT